MTATPSRHWFSLCNCGLSHEPRLNRRDLLIGGAATLAFGAAATSRLRAESGGAGAVASHRRASSHLAAELDR